MRYISIVIGLLLFCANYISVDAEPVKKKSEKEEASQVKKTEMPAVKPLTAKKEEVKQEAVKVDTKKAAEAPKVAAKKEPVKETGKTVKVEEKKEPVKTEAGKAMPAEKESAVKAVKKEVIPKKVAKEAKEPEKPAKVVAPEKKPVKAAVPAQKVKKPVRAAKAPVKKAKVPAKVEVKPIKKAVPAKSVAKAEKKIVKAGLTLERSSICADVVDHEPKGTAEQFVKGVKSLFCFSHIKGAPEKSKILHKWYFKDKLITTIPLEIRANNFRTFSKRSIKEDQVGKWKVEIVDGAKKAVLQTLNFVIK